MIATRVIVIVCCRKVALSFAWFWGRRCSWIWLESSCMASGLVKRIVCSMHFKLLGACSYAFCHSATTTKWFVTYNSIQCTVHWKRHTFLVYSKKSFWFNFQRSLRQDPHLEDQLDPNLPRALVAEDPRVHRHGLVSGLWSGIGCPGDRDGPEGAVPDLTWRWWVSSAVLTVSNTKADVGVLKKIFGTVGKQGSFCTLFEGAQMWCCQTHRGDDSPSQVLQDELQLCRCLALRQLQVGRVEAFTADRVQGTIDSVSLKYINIIHTKSEHKSSKLQTFQIPSGWTASGRFRWYHHHEVLDRCAVALGRLRLPRPRSSVGTWLLSFGAKSVYCI